jgi:NitT/TauT family transport system substrate-binding protein
LNLNALKAKEIDVGFSNTMSFLLARSQGINMISLGGVAVNDKDHTEGAILVQPDSNIKSIADLRNKTIAINASNNIVELALRKLIKQNGVNPNNVRFLEIAFPKMETVLKLGEVDAIAVAEPFWTMAVRNGNGRIIGHYFGDVYDRIEIAGWFVDAQWFHSNSNLADRIQRALQKASVFAANPNNENRLREIVQSYTELDAETSSQMHLPTFAPQLTTQWLDTLMNDMLMEGYLEQRIEIKPAIMN